MVKFSLPKGINGMKKIDLGFMNENFIDENRFVKKIKPLAADYLNQDNIFQSMNEIRKQISSKSNVVVPKNVYFENQRLVSEYEYFDNAKNLTIDEIDKFFDQIICLLKELHTIKTKDLDFFNPNKKIEYFLSRIDECFYDYKNYLKDVTLIFDLMKENYKPAFCHNDLNLNNFILVNDELKLIDFDTATLSYAIFDYVSFITESLTMYQKYDEANVFIQKLMEQKLVSKEEMPFMNKMFKAESYLWTLWANYFYTKEKNEIFRNIAAVMWENFINDDIQLIK
jgi:thiamine kinase-like enzyme